MQKIASDLVAHIAPIGGNEPPETFQLYSDTEFPGEYVILLEGISRPLSHLQGAYNICIEKKKGGCPE